MRRILTAWRRHRAVVIGVVVGVVLWGCTNSLPELSSSEAEPSAGRSSVATSATAQGQILPISAQVEIADQIIELEVARTSSEQAMGLMFREELADNQGMLFPFNNPRPVSFWMRNVLINLDMVFLRDGEVVAIADNVPPCATPTCPTYGPNATVDQVIELRGGRSAELGLQPGDRLSIEFLE